MEFFEPAERDRLQEVVLSWARADERVVAAALVGSLAGGAPDRWSDLDLTFGLAAGVEIATLLEEWTARLREDFGARVLFDLPVGPTVYRVHLLPRGLQFDLSFAPAPEFGARGPHFELLFGKAVEHPRSSPARAEHIFGVAAHHVLRSRICVERGRLWQAEYWTSLVRDHALDLACLRHGLSTHHGRGYDDLPQELRADLDAALVRALEPDEILRALRAAVDGLLRNAGSSAELAKELRALAQRAPGEMT